MLIAIYRTAYDLDTGGIASYAALDGGLAPGDPTLRKVNFDLKRFSTAALTRHDAYLRIDL